MIRRRPLAARIVRISPVVADIGCPAWTAWVVAHIFFLIGFRNRVMVSAQWALAYLTPERGNRLLIRRDARP